MGVGNSTRMGGMGRFWVALGPAPPAPPTTTAAAHWVFAWNGHTSRPRALTPRHPSVRGGCGGGSPKAWGVAKAGVGWPGPASRPFLARARLHVVAPWCRRDRAVPSLFWPLWGGERRFHQQPAAPPLSAPERRVSVSLPACTSTASVRALPRTPSSGTRPVLVYTPVSVCIPLTLPACRGFLTPHPRPCARLSLSSAAPSTPALRHAVPRVPSPLLPPPPPRRLWSYRHHG